jgi:hypothetical protein
MKLTAERPGDFPRPQRAQAYQEPQWKTAAERRVTALSFLEGIGQAYGRDGAGC